MSIAITLVGLLLFLMFIQVPIGFALVISSAVAFTIYNVPIHILAQNLYTGVSSFTWIAIPMFILAGNLMSRGGLSRRLVNFSEAILGTIRGGVGMTTIFASAFFASISGASPATCAAIGSVMVPEMKQRNYPEKFAAGIAASGGVLGVLIPPSISFVAYGVLAQVSVAKLFLAGIIPGILTAMVMVVVTYLLARKYLKDGAGNSSKRFSLRQIFQTGCQGFFSLMAPVLILGGIYMGVFTPTESAVVAVFYGLAVGLFYRELDWEGFWECVRATVTTTGTLAIIWAAAASYSYILTISNVAQNTVIAFQGISSSPIVVVLLLSAIVVVLGCFINSMGMIILLTPIFVPILKSVGFDPLVFGILFVLLCEIGYLTPPVGTNLFVARALVQKADVLEIATVCIPYMICLYAMMLFFLFFPEVVSFIPNLTD
ncbi:TRAP transporter large permease [Desulfovibrio sp. SGI.169]|uniref:TRAP transporter large permease n=1 Tax=Desulfovibrio sp. SGI.169 TaxID=3420561 RepID=UPI003D04EFDA